jgi:hypothetical protein
MRRLPPVLAAIVLFALANGLSARALRVTPALPTGQDPVEVVVSGFGCSPGEGGSVEIDGRDVSVQLPAFNPCFRPFYWNRTVEIGRVDPGTYTVEVSVGGEPFERDDFVVREETALLGLHGQRFQVTVEWRDSLGNSGQGRAVPLGDESGYFWFFDSANAELMLKVLDARTVNGHYWVFLGSLTDVEVTVTVLDIGDGLCLELPVVPPACPTRTYLQPLGENRNVLDTQAFPEG